MNFLPVHAPGGRADGGRADLRLPAGRALPTGDSSWACGPSTWRWRPPGRRRRLPGTVTQVQDLGTHLLLTATVAGQVRSRPLDADSGCPRAATPAWLQVLGTHTCFYRTRSSSHDTTQARQPEGLVADAAGADVRRLLRHPAADDGGQLLGAGHHLARAARVRRHRMVRLGDARRGAACALLRQLGFSLAVLAVEIPLGILLALSMPAEGWKSSPCWCSWRCRC
jgi:hypothetical protein